MGIYRSEWKYCINDTTLSSLRERLSAVMIHDPHADENGKYEIHSLYFDDFFNTSARNNVDGVSKRFKYRIRYYNNNTEFICLEKKIKNNSFGSKDNCLLTKEEYRQIVTDDVSDLYWSTDKKLLRDFCLDISSYGFRPKVIVDYEREAFVEPISNVRITFDRIISASDDIEDFLDGSYSRIPIIPDKMNVMEVKFDEVLPAYIRKIIQVGRVNQRSFSKYYLCRVAMQNFKKL